jgi:CHAT domain-containing protein
MSLARTLFRVGSVSSAAELSARGLASLERRDTDDLELARALVMRADLERAWGDFANARTHYERGLLIRERVLGESSPLVGEAHFGLGEVLVGLDDGGAAFEQALKAEVIGRGHLSMTLRYLPERQSLSYAARRPKSLDLALSLSGVEAKPPNSVFDALIRGRALVLDEMAARHRVSADASRADVALLWAALASARQRLANLVVRGPSDSQPHQYVMLVEDARREKELAERALADKSAAFREELARGEIGLDDVRRALPAGSALVAFARYDRTPVSGPGATAPRETAPSTAATRRTPAVIPSYIAFVMREGQSQIAVVPIGAATGVDALVSRWHADILNIVGADSPSEIENAYRVTGAALRRRVWDPVASYVKGAGTVFVVPDGTLNLLSLAALPVGRIGYLIDQGPVIHYLSAERDLVTSSPAAAVNRGLLAVGGAAFDDATLFTGKVARPRPATRPPAVTAVSGLRAACGDLASLTFDPLAGTLQEVREVARLWSDSPADVLQDRGASEGAFKRAAPGHRVLHLATHGFFLGSACQRAIGGTRAVGGLAPKRPGQSSAGIADNPLLLSGLALAGANRRAAAGPGDDDGILTAEEVAGLDLRGVEWAVLSACDTGLGEMKAGEGVFGLRRAFQIAGARTVIMSLWSVDDEATRLWMRALYEGRLKKHLSTADAMQQAGLSVLRARRARGETTHPFYWAGFVAAGDWR